MQHENKVVAQWCEMAYGPMRRLRDEIGLKDRFNAISYIKQADIEKITDESFGQNPDQEVTVQYFANALFTPIDMTEYEDVFCGEYYSSKPLPHTNAEEMNCQYETGYETAHELSEPQYVEIDKPVWGVSAKSDDRRAELLASFNVEDEDSDEDEGEGDEEEDEEMPDWREIMDPKRDKSWDAENHVIDDEWPPKEAKDDEQPQS